MIYLLHGRVVRMVFFDNSDCVADSSIQPFRELEFIEGPGKAAPATMRENKTRAMRLSYVQYIVLWALIRLLTPMCRTWERATRLDVRHPGGHRGTPEHNQFLPLKVRLAFCGCINQCEVLKDRSKLFIPNQRKESNKIDPGLSIEVGPGIFISSQEGMGDLLPWERYS